MKKIIDTAKLLPPFEELVSVEAMRSLILRPEAIKLQKKVVDGKNLYIFLGSSGAGRDTVMEECLRPLSNSVRLRRTTTRKPREYIADQKRMIFITEKAFLRDFKTGMILFAGRYKANQKLYGISRKEILKLKNKKSVYCFLEGNFSEIPLKVMFPKAKLIVILPPTIDVLKERLFFRDGHDEVAEKRFAISLLEIKTVLKNLKELIDKKFIDSVVINEGFPKKVGERTVRAIRNNQKLIEDFSTLGKSLR